MPSTRKSSSTPPRATRSKGAVGILTGKPISKPKDERKTTLENEQKTHVQKQNKISHKEVPGKIKQKDQAAITSPNSRKVRIDANVDVEKGVLKSQIADEALQNQGKSGGKRKASVDVSKEEPAKRSKVMVPEVLSPRRSSRAVIPNSRYKDMELGDFVKKKSNAEKMTVPRNAQEVDDINIPGVHIQVEPDVQISIVSEEIITYDTQMHANLQLIDDILVLPPKVDTEPNSDDEKDTPKPNVIHVTSGVSTYECTDELCETLTVESEEFLNKESNTGNDHAAQSTESDLQSHVVIKDASSPKKKIVFVTKDAKTFKEEPIINIAPSANKIVISDELLEKSSTEPVINQVDSVSVLKVSSRQGEKTGVTAKVLTLPSGVKVINPGKSQNINTTNTSEISPKTVSSKDIQQKLPQLISTSDKNSIQVISPAGRKTTGSIVDAIISGIGKKGSMVIHTPAKALDQQNITKYIQGNFSEQIQPSTKVKSIEDNLETAMTDQEGHIERIVPKTWKRNPQKVQGGQPHVKVMYVKVKPNDLGHKETSQSNLETLGKHTAVKERNQTESPEGIGLQSTPVEIKGSMAIDSVLQMYTSKLKEIIKEKGTKVIEIKPNKQQDVNSDELRLDLAADSAVESTDGSRHSGGKVCSDQQSVSSPQVAIEYVVVGDKVLPFHKPFSQTNAASYNKKRSTIIRKIPSKEAQILGGTALDGVETETAFSIEMDTEGDSYETNESVILEENSMQQSDEMTAQIVHVPSSEVIQQKPGRVIHGFVSKPEVNTGPTEIIEISQDLFAKEVYGEQAILDPATGQMVIVDNDVKNVREKSEDICQPGRVLTTDVTQFIVNEGMTAVETGMSEQTGEMIVAGSVENNTFTGDGTVEGEFEENIAGDSNIVAKPKAKHTGESTAGENENPLFNLENMSEGETVILQINSDGVVVGETPAYKAVTGVRINPAVAVVTTTASGVRSDKQHIVTMGGSKSPGCVQVKPVRASSSTDQKREIETQTEEESEEEGEDEGENNNEMDSEEEGRNPVNKSTVVVSGDDHIRRTTVMMEENGQVQEFVVVHLPEGAEIKQQEVKQNVEDPVHNEVVTISDDGMYVCMDCNHKTDKKGNWYKHRRKHLGIRPHGCPKCSYKAATSSNLKRHMQIHDDVRDFECSTCGLFFRQKIHLERHIKYKHQEKKVKCPLCDYLCSSENPDLKIHIRRRHMPQEDGSMSAFTCSECGLMTVSKKDLKQHMKFHKKGPELKLFCEFCSFVTDCESRLRRHMLIHTKEKPFQCGLCSYRASQKEHVLRHMKTQHDVEVERKPRRSLIGETTTKPKHRRSLLDDGSPTDFDVGTGQANEQVTDKLFQKSDYSSTDKIFACNHCSMKFSKLINLYKHLFAQHKQVMPDTSSNFQCVVCDFRTNNKKNLLVHMRKHNMHDHSPPTHVYSCVLCRYINPRRRNLFQHMKKKHGIEIIMRDDGYNCYVSGDMIAGHGDGEPSVMALSEIVKTHPLLDDSQLQIISDDGTTIQAEKILDNIMLVDDISAYESTSSQDQSITSQITTIPSTPLYQSSIAEHEAAEAIEGLQALAEQAAGVVETQPMDSDITTEIITSDILTDGEIMTTEEETLVEQNVEDDGIELSTEQLSQLSAGDYVEINGEVYKVEIAPENASKMELAIESA